MREPDWKNCTANELWRYVGHHLAKNGISSILVGGAVVSIYSKGAFQSGDLDFVLETIRLENLPQILSQIGFLKKSGRHYVHPECKHLFIEFVTPPVGIGNDTGITPNEIKVESHTIKILSPTDCIRDRLASAIHFNSRESIEQAVLVARKQKFNLSKVESFCRKEGGETVFKMFLELWKS